MRKKFVLVSLALLLLAAMCMPAMAWSGTTHEDSASLAAMKKSVYGTEANSIVSGSSAPDTWGYWEILSHGKDDLGAGCAPVKAAANANDAANLYDSGDTLWATKIGYAMHYMTDMSMPWHTNSAYYSDRGPSSTHDILEGDVGYTQRTYYYSQMNMAGSSNWVSNPATSAYDLASLSSQVANYIAQTRQSNPYWLTDSTLKQTVGSQIREATKTNMGLIEYAKR